MLMTRSRYGDYNGQTHANFFLRNTLPKHIPKRLVPPQAGAGKLPFRASSASSQQDGGQWAVEKDVVVAWVQLMGAEVLGLKETYVRTCQVGAELQSAAARLWHAFDRLSFCTGSRCGDQPAPSAHPCAVPMLSWAADYNCANNG